MGGSIDYIDDAGREWTHASRYRVLEEENAALRKRVEELEAHERQTHETLGAILGTDDALHVLAARLKERAEKAELERDSYRRDFDACAHALDKLQADLDKMRQERDEFARKAVEMELLWSGTNAELEDVKADLDAALTVIDCMDRDDQYRPEEGCVSTETAPEWSAEEREAARRIEALLEKRRKGHHRGGWICSECGHAEQREREVLCWNCGKGEMQFNASLVFPLAPSEARRG